MKLTCTIIVPIVIKCSPKIGRINRLSLFSLLFPQTSKKGFSEKCTCIYRKALVCCSRIHCKQRFIHHCFTFHISLSDLQLTQFYYLLLERSCIEQLCCSPQNKNSISSSSANILAFSSKFSPVLLNFVHIEKLLFFFKERIPTSQLFEKFFCYQNFLLSGMATCHFCQNDVSGITTLWCKLCLFWMCVMMEFIQDGAEHASG